MKAKEKHKTRMLTYLSNPDNEMPNREQMASIIGIKKATLYMHFTPQELSEIEAEGLAERRKKYAPHLTQVDLALLKKAKDGDAQAAKLAYQRFEQWSEKKQHEHSGPGGGPVEMHVNFVGNDDGNDDGNKAD